VAWLAVAGTSTTASMSALKAASQVRALSAVPATVSARARAGTGLVLRGNLVIVIT
jgi:hypothetical protein